MNIVKLLVLSSILFTLTPAFAAEEEIEILYHTQKLTPEAAQIVANAALNECRKQGAQVAVAVLDPGGNIQVIIRDNLAGYLTSEGAILKAKTAINFRIGTKAFTAAVQSDPSSTGIATLPGVILLGGGLPILTSSLIGGIGVAGAPNGNIDESCALAGINAIQEELSFAE